MDLPGCGDLLGGLLAIAGIILVICLIVFLWGWLGVILGICFTILKVIGIMFISLVAWGGIWGIKSTELNIILKYFLNILIAAVCLLINYALLPLVVPIWLFWTIFIITAIALIVVVIFGERFEFY